MRRIAGTLPSGFRWQCGHARRPYSGLWPPTSRLALGTAATIAAVGLAMLFLDAAGGPCRSLPLWLILTFDELTDFGRSRMGPDPDRRAVCSPSRWSRRRSPAAPAISC